MYFCYNPGCLFFNPSVPFYLAFVLLILLVWVFEYKGDLDDFINSGWEFGGQGTVAAQASGEGTALAGAISIKPGVWLYQLTDDGLALELTAKGT
jgi:hypothetical protein